ncbi:hypothetical protein pb186bvf_001281 [Paramecium bursaria]
MIHFSDYQIEYLLLNNLIYVANLNGLNSNGSYLRIEKIDKLFDNRNK